MMQNSENADCFEDPRCSLMFQKIHSILKWVFRIITHLTISAETEEIRKLKMPFNWDKLCKYTYYYTDSSYHENPTCSNISRLIKFPGWRKMFVYKV